MWRWEARERRFRASTRGLNPSLWRPRYKWDARRIRGRDGSEDFLQPSAVRNSRKRLDSNNFFFVARVFFNLPSALTWATETVTFASVTQRESNRLHDAPLLYTPRTITTSLHFPARTPGKARGAGGTRVAGTSRTSPLVAGRARARPRSRAPRPSRARILIGRSGRSTETPRRLAFRARSTRAPGFPLRFDGRTVPRAPRARVSHLPQRRDGVRDSEGARPRAGGEAVRRDPLPRRGFPRRAGRRDALGRVHGAGPGALRGMRRDEARAKCLSTTRDGLAFPRHTPRPFGFGGTRSARRRHRRGAARERPPRAVRLRRRARRVAPRDGACGCARARLGHHERCARRGAQEHRVRKPFAASSRTPGDARASPWSARETTRRRERRLASASRVGDDSEPFGEALRVAFPGGAREASDDPRVEGERRVAEPETAGGRDPGDEKKRREKSRLARRRRPRRVRSARAKVTRKATRREATRVLFP